MVTAIGGGMPGHWRNTTAKQRAVLYTIVIVLVGAFTLFLFRLWAHLQEEYDPDKLKPPGPDLLDRIHEREVREGRA